MVLTCKIRFRRQFELGETRLRPGTSWIHSSDRNDDSDAQFNSVVSASVIVIVKPAGDGVCLQVGKGLK